jgi:hypothetical protein
MRVWYAAYGSNMSRSRFDYYLRGGRPEGSHHTYPGCRDDTPPTADVAGEIAAMELAFGGRSQTWGGGVAFVRPITGERAKARLYLLTLEQFADVVAQENHLTPGSVDVPAEPGEIEGEHMYRVVLAIGARKDPPVLTVSQPSQAVVAPPSLPYLKHIALGLRETHAMSGTDIVDYLAARPGVRGMLQPELLAAVVS